MQLQALFAAAAVFAVASAKVSFTDPTFATVTAGKPFELTWTDATGPVTITLKGKQPGATITDPNNLATLQTLTSGQSGKSFTWDVPATISHETYAFFITDGATDNYSTLFEVIGGVTPSASASVSHTSASASGSQSAASVSSSASAQTQSASESLTTSTRTSSSSTRAASAPAATTSTTAPPAGGMATGLTSNLALVFVVVGALFMLN